MNYPYRYDNPPLQEFFKKLNCYSILNHPHLASPIEGEGFTSITGLYRISPENTSLIKIVIPAVFKRQSRVFLFSPVSQKTLDAR